MLKLIKNKKYVFLTPINPGHQYNPKPQNTKHSYVSQKCLHFPNNNSCRRKIQKQSLKLLDFKDNK